MFSRRSFLSRAGLVAASSGVVGAPYIAHSAEALASKPGQKPGRIIHIVSDGMSMGTLTCADHFSQVHRKQGLSWLRLTTDPAARQGWMNTRSLNSLVTDSSAASCAWGSGSRIVNGALNVLPNGTRLTPIYELFRQQGWARGLVTTAELTHATPAGFAAATISRGDAAEIADQYLEREIDVLLGGGTPHFDAAKRKDKRDLRGDFAKAGYTVVGSLSELQQAPIDTRLLGTFADSHLPYTIDHLANPKLKEKVPTIAEMTKAALARLERHEHFILQVEGGRVDHAAHNSDAAAAIRDQIALDEAIDVCLEFRQRHPDTLIVITTDHANSNLGLNGMGGGYRHSSQRFAALAEIKMSFPEILKRIEKAGETIEVPPSRSDVEDALNIPDPMEQVISAAAAKNAAAEPKKNDDAKFTAAVKLNYALRVDPKAIVDIIADTTGYKMSARRAGLFARVLAGEYEALYDQMNSASTQLGQVLANHFGIGWTGNTHTADYCPVLAVGPGAERFAGLIQNTDIFTHYTELAGIDFRNPSLPLIAEEGPDASVIEHIAQYAEADFTRWV